MILCLQQIIDKDPEVKPYLNVVMVNNYNVTLAEKLIPACDISEQISLLPKKPADRKHEIHVKWCRNPWN